MYQPLRDLNIFDEAVDSVDLVDYLGRDQRFEAGCVLLTGTGIVPPSDFTLQDGDEVSIRIDGIGLLENPVRRHASRGESDHP